MDSATILQLSFAAAAVLCLACVGTVLALLRESRALARKLRMWQRIEDRVALLEEGSESLRESLRLISTRQNMRALREKRKENGAAPDWRTDPEGFRPDACSGLVPSHRVQ